MCDLVLKILNDLVNSQLGQGGLTHFCADQLQYLKRAIQYIVGYNSGKGRQGAAELVGWTGVACGRGLVD